MFLHLYVIRHSVHRGVSISNSRPPRADSPLGRHPPPADGYRSGRYASYWNVFVLCSFSPQCKWTLMVYSHCPELEPEQSPETNGLHNSVQKFSHCILTGTGLGTIVPHFFCTCPIPCFGLGSVQYEYPIRAYSHPAKVKRIKQ